MFRFEIRFTLPGSTHVQLVEISHRSPGAAVDEARAQYGDDIKVLQTTCL
jgi:hypothetical protein